MLSVIILNVVILCVVAPIERVKSEVLKVPRK
jgi:hypothetical protein